jgi:cell wall-associated NlpC family hydrolase
MDNTELVIKWATYLLNINKANPGHIDYSEGTNRMDAIGQWPLKFPITTDCSGFITLVCWLSGVADPNGQHYDHEGYTGTLLSHEAHISQFVQNGTKVENVKPGDLVIYGPGTGWHVALIVEVDGDNLLSISNGEQGDPSYVWVNTPTVPDRGHPTDGRQPQTFLRPVYTQTFTPKAIPEAPEVVKIATPDVTPQASVTPPEAPVAPAVAEPVQTPPVVVQIHADTAQHAAALAKAMKLMAEPLLKVGAKGQAVVKLQTALHIKADGIFGSNTESAVKGFQSAHRILADGIVGPTTWAALGL